MCFPAIFFDNSIYDCACPDCGLILHYFGSCVYLFILVK
jgi:hypothetical protein